MKRPSDFLPRRNCLLHITLAAIQQTISCRLSLHFPYKSQIQPELAVVPSNVHTHIFPQGHQHGTTQRHQHGTA